MVAFGGFRVSSYLTFNPPLCLSPLIQEHWGPNQTLMLVINLFDPERNGTWWSFPAAATVELFNGRDFSRWCQHWAASLNSSVFQMNVSWMTFERCVPEIFRRKLHLGMAARVVGVDWCVVFFWWRNNKKRTTNGELVSWIRYISEMFWEMSQMSWTGWTWHVWGMTCMTCSILGQKELMSLTNPPKNLASRHGHPPKTVSTLEALEYCTYFCDIITDKTM